MSKRNRDLVTSEVEGVLTYYASILPHAGTAEEWQREVVDLIGHVLDAFADVVTVTEAELLLQSVPRDSSTNDGSPVDQYDARESDEVVVRSDDGITREHIVSAVDDTACAADTTVVPVRFQMTDGSARVFLNQGFLTVDEDCQWYRKRKHNVTSDETPDRPPVHLVFTHNVNTRSSGFIRRYYDSPDEECDTAYDLQIGTTTDLWIVDETGDDDVDAIARINRARFYEAFSGIEDSEDLLATYWISVDFERLPEHVDAVLDYDGPPADELLAEYRRDWVEARLRDQAIGEAVDGERIVHFGPVDEHVFSDELKRRIEVYLRETDQFDVVDQVRVTAHDGETLTGSVRDDVVHWVD